MFSSSQSLQAQVITVDLDGTLTSTDFLYETFLVALKKNPFILFLIPFWLLKGRSFLKLKLAQAADIDVASIPFHEDLVGWLREAKKSGKKLYLVTASHESIAKKVSDYHGFFDDFYGSNEALNLKGGHKAQFLVERFGEKGFVYIGNSNSDKPIWEKAFQAGVVAPQNHGLVEMLKKKKDSAPLVFEKSKLTFKHFVRQVRVHQWSKNILVFLPLLLSHKITDVGLLRSTILAFFSFSFMASSVYIFNDLMDLSHDRVHPKKKTRPLAQGIFPIPWALGLALALLGSGIFLSFQVSISFALVLLLYFAMTSLYSFGLKQVVMLDVIILASLYTVRIFGGSVASTQPISNWFLTFSMFLFFSLALIKRYSELLELKEEEKEMRGRGYIWEDRFLILGLGLTSALLSVLVMAMYINSEDILRLYHHPKILWLAGVVLLYWNSRMWLHTVRGKITGDPVVYTLKDKVSFILLFILVLIGWMAV